MPRIFTLSILVCTICFGCKKIVEIENPVPAPVEFCSALPEQIGQWYTDSVWISTEVDSLDSLIINKLPTQYYLLQTTCNETKSFSLDLINYGGVQTRKVFSSNYIGAEGAYFIFGEHEQEIDTSKSEFVLRIKSFTDTTMTTHFREVLSSESKSMYTLFFKRF